MPTGPARVEQVYVSAFCFHPPPLALCSSRLFHSNTSPLPRPRGGKLPTPITRTPDLCFCFCFCRPRRSCSDPVPFFIFCSFLPSSWLLGSPVHIPFQPSVSSLFPDLRSQRHGPLTGPGISAPSSPASHLGAVPILGSIPGDHLSFGPWCGPSPCARCALYPSGSRWGSGAGGRGDPDPPS